MIVKFLKRGTGSCGATFDYLLGKKRDRELATVLKGDPKLTQMLADSLDFKHKYTVGVLSFQEADLDDKTKQAIMADFEKSLLCGLDQDQYNICWVEHRDKGRLELNFVIPKVELSTGRAMNPYFDSVDKKRMRAFCDLTNATYDLHDPKDPNNRQPLTTPSNLPKDKKELRQAITSHLMQGIENGDIKDRQSVLAELENLGLTIARITPSAISIKDPDGGRNIRLKGELYDENFRFDQDYSKQNQRASQEYRANRERRIQDAKRELDKQSERKREFNQNRFGRQSITNPRDFEPAQDISPTRAGAGFNQTQGHLGEDWGVGEPDSTGDNDTGSWFIVPNSTSAVISKRESTIGQSITADASRSENIRQGEIDRDGRLLLHSEQGQHNDSLHKQRRTNDYENKSGLADYEQRSYAQLNNTLKRARATTHRSSELSQRARHANTAIDKRKSELQTTLAAADHHAREYNQNSNTATQRIQHTHRKIDERKRDADRTQQQASEAVRAITSELSSIEQTIADYKKRFIACHLRWQHTQEKLTHDEKEQIADDTPILELIPQVIRFEREISRELGFGLG